MFDPTLAPWARLIADAQTSGGLLLAVPPDRLEVTVRALAAKVLRPWPS